MAREDYLIQSVRWHLNRYDSLRSSVANRANFILSANAIIVAGVGFLIPQLISKKLFGERISASLIGFGGVSTLVFVGLSVRSAMNALFGRMAWRQLFKSETPNAPFYLHTDTLKAFPSFEAFERAYRAMDRDSELQAATVGLWAGINAHAHRYSNLRRAANHLRFAFSALMLSALCAVVSAVLGSQS